MEKRVTENELKEEIEKVLSADKYAHVEIAVPNFDLAKDEGFTVPISLKVNLSSALSIYKLVEALEETAEHIKSECSKAYETGKNIDRVNKGLNSITGIEELKKLIEEMEIENENQD